MTERIQKNVTVAKALGLVKKCIISNHIEKNTTIVVACSGGQDSLALLGILHLLHHTYPLNIVVGHINHGLRLESENEAHHLKNICESIHVAIEICDLNLIHQPGLAEIARIKRYEALSDIANKHQAKYILVAHTKTDNIETLFLHLIRGTGLDGLEGIKENTHHSHCHIIRPLLGLSRKDTEEICNSLKLKFVKDPTNNNTENLRIKIREIILPMILEENPKFEDVVTSLMSQVRNVNALLDKMSTVEYFKMVIKGLENISLEFGVFNDNPYLVISDLRKKLALTGIDISEIKYSVFQDIYKACTATISKQFDVKGNFSIIVNPKVKSIYVRKKSVHE